MDPHEKAVIPGRREPLPTEIVPVCGMRVDPAGLVATHKHQRRTYYFCTPRCRERFVADPLRYLEPAPAAGPRGAMAPSQGPAPGHAPGVPRTIYTCPMHPEVRRPRPGSCPKCGMALEPETGGLLEEDSPELRDMTRRFAVALALTVPVFLLAMADMLPGRPLHGLIAPAVQPWVELPAASSRTARRTTSPSRRYGRGTGCASVQASASPRTGS